MCVRVYQEAFTSSARINMHEVFIVVCTVCHAAWYRQSTFSFCLYREHGFDHGLCSLPFIFICIYSGSVDGDQKDAHTIYAVQYASWTTLALIHHLLRSCYHDAVVN